MRIDGWRCVVVMHRVVRRSWPTLLSHHFCRRNIPVARSKKPRFPTMTHISTFSACVLESKMTRTHRPSHQRGQLKSSRD